MTQTAQELDFAEEIDSGNFEIKNGQYGYYINIADLKNKNIYFSEKYENWSINLGTKENRFYINFKELTKASIQNGLNYALSKLDKE